MAGPVVLRIKLRYDDIEAMITRFAANVGKSGLFLPTKSVQAIGTEIKFELRLADDTLVLLGLGRVKAVREADPANPRAAFGLALELMRVSKESRELILKMIERRRILGLPEVAIPMPEDVEAARRIDVTTGVVRDVVPAMASAPVVEQLMTAPRMASGPIAVARESSQSVIPVLAPEPTKPRRPRVSELIARASEMPTSTAVPELDEEVDVERAVMRARALAGSDVDGDLAALKDEIAAPLGEIGVEAASAELARQLGGNAVVRKDRLQWVPPPPVEMVQLPAPVPDPEAPAVVHSPPLLIDDNADVARFESELKTPETPVEQLDSFDLEPVDDRTQIAAPLDPETGADLRDDEGEEVSDLDVVAEADLDDADLLESDGEADASGQVQAAPEHEPHIDPRDDFASRLDLSDELDPSEFEERHAFGFSSMRYTRNDPNPYGRETRHVKPTQERYEREDRYERPAGIGGRFEEPSGPGFDPPSDPSFDPSSSYTLAEQPQDNAIEFDEPHAFGHADSVITPPPAAEPRVLRGSPRGKSADDLDSALEALDVDLDELAIPREQPGKRPGTEDGIIIDFDDEE